MSIPKPPDGGAPPSLLGNGSAKTLSSGKPTDDLRMLSGLGPNPSTATSAGAAPRRFGLVIGGVLGVAAMALAFWWQAGSDSAQSVALAPKSLSAPQPPTPEVARATVVESPVAPVPASAPAKIEVISEARPADVASVAAAPEMSAPSSVAPPAAPSPAAAASSSRVPSVRPAATAQRQSKPNTASRTAASIEQRSTATASASPGTKPGAGKDSDVDLLAAIVTHLQGETAKQAPDKSAAITPAKTSSPRTIAQLVRGCKKLGGKEEAVCTRKICDGYWGKAQACPAHAAPREGRV